MNPMDDAFEFEEVSFDERGLVPVVVQEEGGGEVLMLAYADREALRLTLDTGFAHYFSRSRSRLWKKGETSGNVQRVTAVAVDCDGDALLYEVRQTGAACHTGEHSCFYRRLSSASASASPRGEPAVDGDSVVVRSRSSTAEAFDLLERVVADRFAQLPEGSYVTELNRRGTGYIAQKVVEEAGETIVAALSGSDGELAGEAADLLFHLAVLLRARGVGLAAPAGVLLARHRGRRGDAE